MTPTLVYMLIPGYLLVGCVLMLIVNELVYGAVTKREFVRGMLVWPLMCGRFLSVFFSIVMARYRG